MDIKIIIAILSIVLIYRIFRKNKPDPLRPITKKRNSTRFNIALWMGLFTCLEQFKIVGILVIILIVHILLCMLKDKIKYNPENDYDWERIDNEEKQKRRSGLRPCRLNFAMDSNREETHPVYETDYEDMGRGDVIMNTDLLVHIKCKKCKSIWKTTEQDFRRSLRTGIECLKCQNKIKLTSDSVIKL